MRVALCSFATLCLLAGLLALAGCGGSSDDFAPPASVVTTAETVDYLAWSEYAANPVVDPGVEIYYPSVIYDGSTYSMWASCNGVSMFTSSDGISWSAGATCTGLPPAAHHVQVIANPDTGNYEMWYWTGTIYSIAGLGHAVSSDGVNWTGAGACAQLPAPNRLVTGVNPTRGTYGPCQVFYNSGGLATLDPENPFANKYVMYYDQTSGGTETIGLAASADGITWGVPSALEGQPVLGLGPAGSWDSKYATYCSIMEDAAGYHMYYSGGAFRAHEGIGYAYSADGISWAKAADPIFHISDGVAWRVNRCYTPSIVVVDGEAQMIFTGDGSEGRCVGLATLALEEPDTAPPAVVLNSPDPASLWPPNHKSVSVSLGGSVTDDGSGVARAWLAIGDEYGELDEVIDVTELLNADGAFATNIDLTAWREGNDKDGRVYTISLCAVDVAGNQAVAVSRDVVVPHDQGKQQQVQAGNTNQSGKGGKK
ncbi:MAG TPA: hypothetical protein DGT21_09175 [Armatimonadetes bacterium]|jgi:predicted small lipoprotein YifL|nr:hypothetical protein [Armatimonadota bacterium]